MRMFAATALVVLLSMLPRQAGAQDEVYPRIFLGEVRSIFLTRPAHELPPPPNNTADGLIISNSCGEEVVDFRVVRSVAPMTPNEVVHFGVGEWCRLPVTFGTDQWLIVPLEDGQAGDLMVYPLVFQVMTSGGVDFVFIEDGHLNDASAAARPYLTFQPLPEPVAYPREINLRDAEDRDYVRRQPNLQIRDGKVWIVRGILLSSLFRGYEAPDE